MIIKDSESQLTEEALSGLETRLRISLPEEYRRFLLVHNGGYPEPSTFQYLAASGRNGESCVDWFLSVYDGEYKNFETYFLNNKVESQRLPPELIPIAHDPGGNLICIVASGSQSGAIVFWAREFESPAGEPPTMKNARPIADSFSSFLDGLSK